GELARSAGIRNPLLVTDAGIVAAGHLERASASLASAGIQPLVYDRARENPTTTDVENCLAFAREAAGRGARDAGPGPDGLIGLGGGSSLDTAKGCNFLLTSGGRMQDYRGYG